MADNNDTLTALDKLKFAKAVVNSASSNSVTRMAAKDSMFIYPMVMCSDVPTDDAMPYVKDTERMLAALLVSIISVNSDFNLEKYSSPAEYLKKFHSNENTSAVFRALSSAVNQATEAEVDAALKMYQELRKCTECEITSASIVPDDIARTLNPDFVMEAFIDTGIAFSDVHLNSIYTPHVGTQEAMESVIGELHALMRPAMEASRDSESAAAILNNVVARDKKGVSLKENGGAPDKASKEKETRAKMQVARDANGQPIKVDGKVIMKPMKDTNGKIIMETTERNKILSRQTGKQTVVRNDRLTGMEPTLVTLQLTGYSKGGASIVNNVVLAIKVDCRQCPADVMVENLTNAVMGSRAVFNFIKWTRNQYSILKDFILGISSAKEAAVGSRDTKQWLASLKRGKLSSAVSRLTGDTMPPITIVVVTANDVAKVQERTGVDLSQAFSALKMMNKYFMLGFSIIDTANGKVSSIYDGDTDFSVTTLNALRGRNSSKDTDLSTYVSILRAAGGLR